MLWYESQMGHLLEIQKEIDLSKERGHPKPTEEPVPEEIAKRFLF